MWGLVEPVEDPPGGRPHLDCREGSAGVLGDGGWQGRAGDVGTRTYGRRHAFEVACTHYAGNAAAPGGLPEGAERVPTRALSLFVALAPLSSVSGAPGLLWTCSRWLRVALLVVAGRWCAIVVRLFGRAVSAAYVLLSACHARRTRDRFATYTIAWVARSVWD